MKIGYDPEVRYRHLEIDARARVAWGHQPQRIEAFLRANEMPSGRIRRVLDAAIAERDEAFRKRGLWDLALAAVISLIALGPVIPALLQEGLSGLWLAPEQMLVLFVACWLTAKGGMRLAFGSAGEDGSVADADPVNEEIAWRLKSGVLIVILVSVGMVVANLLR